MGYSSHIGTYMVIPQLPRYLSYLTVPYLVTAKTGTVYIYPEITWNRLSEPSIVLDCYVYLLSMWCWSSTDLPTG